MALTLAVFFTSFTISQLVIPVFTDLEIYPWYRLVTAYAFLCAAGCWFWWLIAG
jgi:hypothetical protein